MTVKWRKIPFEEYRLIFMMIGEGYDHNDMSAKWLYLGMHVLLRSMPILGATFNPGGGAEYYVNEAVVTV